MKILVIALIAAVSLLPGAELPEPKTFTPRPDSPTAMRGCGVDLQELKEKKEFSRRFVFTGEEVLLNMHFCKGGKASVDGKSRYQVPAGTIGWTDEDGEEVVLEECANEAEFETAVPEETPDTPEVPLVPDLPERTPPDLSVPTWTPATPTVIRVVEQPCRCVAIRSSWPLAELKSSDKAIDVWAEIVNGTVTDGVWTLDGKEIGRGLRITVDPKQLYKAVDGKAGDHFLHFKGKDSKGNVVACGNKGTVLTLVKQGRGWFWKLPLVHCAYTYTHDIKKWKHGPLAEKLVCPAEIWAVWYAFAGEELFKDLGIPAKATLGRLP